MRGAGLKHINETGIISSADNPSHQVDHRTCGRCLGAGAKVTRWNQQTTTMRAFIPSMSQTRLATNYAIGFGTKASGAIWSCEKWLFGLFYCHLHWPFRRSPSSSIRGQTQTAVQSADTEHQLITARTTRYEAARVHMCRNQSLVSPFTRPRRPPR